MTKTNRARRRYNVGVARYERMRNRRRMAWRLDHLAAKLEASAEGFDALRAAVDSTSVSRWP